MSCRGSLQHASAGSGPTSSAHAPPWATVPPTRCQSLIGSETASASIGLPHVDQREPLRITMSLRGDGGATSSTTGDQGTSMLPTTNLVASADCGWPSEAPSSAGATRRIRLGHGCEKAADS
jgi:hypothetical protein